MAYSVGQFLPISIVPFTVYYDSDRAAAKNKALSGQYYKTGNYRIINVYYDHNGSAYASPRSSTDVPLYAVNDPDGDYGIGWVREDEVLNKRASISGVPNMDVNGTGTINLSDYTSASTYQAEVRVGGTLVKSFRISSNPYSLRFTQSEQNKIIELTPTTTSTTGTLYVTTTSPSGKDLGTVNRTFSINLSGVASPPTIDRIRLTSTELIDGKVYTKANLTITIEATPSPNSTIKSYTIDYDGKTYNSRVATAASETAGRKAVTATVVDSRGQRSTRTSYVTVHERPRISINQQTAERISDTSGRFIVIGTADYNFIKSFTYTIQLYESNGRKVGTDQTGTTSVSTNGRFTINRTRTGLSKDKAYSVRVALRSPSGVVTNLSMTLGTSEVPQSLGKHGTGVGVRFDNDDPANLQVGKGGIRSEGTIFIGDMSITNLINQAVSRAVSSMKPPEPSQPQPTGITIDQAFAGANYGRLVINGNMMIKWGKATVTGQTYTVNFNTYGGAFREAPFVLVSAVSGRWEFAMPSLTTVTTTGFTASTVNAANQQAIGTSHTVNYLALGRK